MVVEGGWKTRLEVHEATRGEAWVEREVSGARAAYS